MNDQPDPFRQLLQSAIATHEIYTSYVEAGFTPDQALELLKAHIIAAGKN